MITLYSYDWLEVYDGNNADAPLMRGQRFCGDTVPEPIISTTNKLLLRFYSYRASLQRGYHIRVTLGKLEY